MKQTSTTPSRLRNRLCGSILAVAVLYLLLLVPAPESRTPTGPAGAPFAWNRDTFWASLEAQFREARRLGCGGLADRIDTALDRVRRSLEPIASEGMGPGDARFGLLETNLFELAPLVAACPARLVEFERLFTALRSAVKAQSEHWDMNSDEARQTVYRLIYGGRAALEEALLQAGNTGPPAGSAGPEEGSRTPASRILGVTVHSGDILVSRGGAPTSALIARGNDYPGNFSHIALLHVDEKSGAVSVIEAHIERGVVVSSLEEYLADKKLRVLVLRLRSDLPQVAADPLLPHAAASRALREARARHIPYDFAMDYHDHRRQFCSEVAAAAYERSGVRLWMGISRLSARGVRSWLGAFGVKEFETQEPSDLEYDPQLRVVAEWRDRETLFQDHADNAVTDVLLEEAETGGSLGYRRLLLPSARVAKGYSFLLNELGRVGPVPEGMDAVSALRHRAFSERHAAIRTRLLTLADAFKRKRGYTAPYWELVNLARQAKRDLEIAQ
jgi:hypothetical protein